MKISAINQNLRILIKKVSIVMITGAIILQLFYLYAVLNAVQISPPMENLIRLTALALLIHFLEGILACFLAFVQQKNPVAYAVYTFFTGTISLLELFESN